MERVQPVDTNQKGIAAIEFALSITIVLMLFFGIVTYGALFWTQQKVTQLAAEGGRYAVAASMRQIHDTDSLQLAVCTKHIELIAKDDLLLKSLQTGESSNGSEPSFCQLTVIPCPTDPEEAECAEITITANGTKDWPLMTIMRGLASVFTNEPEKLVPEKLTSRAVVQIMYSGVPVS